MCRLITIRAWSRAGRRTIGAHGGVISPADGAGVTAFVRTVLRLAQMYSRSLPLFARAGRPPLPGILSTKPSWLLPGAFGLAPPLHDDKPRTSVPRPPLRLRSQNHQLPCSALLRGWN